MRPPSALRRRSLQLLTPLLWCLGACSHLPPPRALTPSLALERAACLSDAGDELQALGVLSLALCQVGHRQTGTKAVQPQALERSVALLSGWARTWDVTGRPVPAKAALLRCLEGGPLAPLTAMVLADATGDWEEVVRLGERHLVGAQPPLRGEYLLRHAVATMHLGRTSRAVGLLTQAVQEAPQNADLYVALAQGQAALGLYDAVRPSLLPLLQLAQAPSATVLARARSILLSAREASAPPMTPADLAEHADLTAVAAGADTSADDLAHVRKIAKDSQQPRLYTLCALILLRQGELSLGRALLLRASEALPLDPDPSRLLAVHRLTEQDWDGALVALAEAVRRNPFDAEAQIMLASVAARTGAHALAVRAYGALVRLEPGVQAHRTGLAQAEQAARLTTPRAPANGPAQPAALGVADP